MSNEYTHFNISTCQMWPQVMARPLILLRFLSILIHFWWLNCCIFTKRSQIVCLIGVHFLKCQHTKCNCRLWKVLWFNCVLGEFCLKRYNSIKLLQIVCKGRSVEIKSKPMLNHLWLHQSGFSLSFINLMFLWVQSDFFI